MIAVKFCEQKSNPSEIENKIKTIGFNKETQPTKEIHQICDDNKDENVTKVTPIDGKTFLKPTSLDGKNDVLYKQLLETKHNETLKSFKMIERIDDGIEAKTISPKQNDAFEKENIKNVDCIREENLSNVSEDENNHSSTPLNSNEVGLNQLLNFETSNIDSQTSLNIIRKIEQFDYLSNVSNEKNNSSFGFQKSSEDVANQPLMLNTIEINPHTLINTNDASMIPNSLIGSKFMPDIFDEFGRIIRQETNKSKDESMHYVDENNKTNTQCLRINMPLSIKSNQKLEDSSLNSFLKTSNRQNQRFFYPNVIILVYLCNFL